MPYKAKGKCVYKADTGKKVGCTKGPVKKYLAALHANVPDAKNEEIEETMNPIKLSEIAKKVINENKSARVMLNGKEVDASSIEIDGVDPKDYPDFSDAYISAANYVDGTPVDDNDLEELEKQNYGLTNDLAHGNLFEEGEEEKLGGAAYDREDAEQRKASKKHTCKVCKKPFTPSYGEYHRCPSCMSKQHSDAEKSAGTQ